METAKVHSTSPASLFVACPLVRYLYYSILAPAGVPAIDSLVVVHSALLHARHYGVEQQFDQCLSPGW